MEPVAVVVVDGEELPISTCLTQHRLAHQLGSSSLLQKGPVLDPLMLAAGHAIQPCSLLKVCNILKLVEESLDIRSDSPKDLLLVGHHRKPLIINCRWSESYIWKSSTTQLDVCKWIRRVPTSIYQSMPLYYRCFYPHTFFCW